MTFNSTLKTYLLLLFTAATWGGTFVAVKFIVADITPLMGAFLRFLCASLCLAPVLYAKEGKKAFQLPLRDLPLMLFLGATGIAMYNFFFFNGLSITSAINGGLIIPFSPVITTVLSPFFLGEEFRLQLIAGFLISLAGVFYIICRGSLEVLKSVQFNHGDLLILGGAVSWSLYSMGGKLATQKYSSLLCTSYACVLGMIMLFFLSIPQWESFSPGQLTSGSITAILFMGLIGSSLSFVLWYDGIKKIGASRAAIFQNFVPVFSALFSIVLLGESLYPYHLWGAALVLLGVTISNNQFSLKQMDSLRKYLQAVE